MRRRLGTPASSCRRRRLLLAVWMAACRPGALLRSSEGGCRFLAASGYGLEWRFSSRRPWSRDGTGRSAVAGSCGGRPRQAPRRRLRSSAAARPGSVLAASGGITTHRAEAEQGGSILAGSRGAEAEAEAERAFRKLAGRHAAQKGGWGRFRPLVGMALARASAASAGEAEEGSGRAPSLADVGCDHGLLSACLAATGRFRTVVGVDSSRAALESGAFALRDRIDAFRARTGSQNRTVPPPLDLEYRWGDGLRGLRPGQADIVVVAGMGAATMADILTETAAAEPRRRETQSAAGNATDQPSSWLAELGCRAVLVQPTCARPRNLFLLYGALGAAGYFPKDERVVLANSRWCFSASFEPSNNGPAGSLKDLALPGSILARASSVESPDNGELVLGFLTHYCNWLNQDIRVGGSVGAGEAEWLSHFGAIRDRLEKRRNL